MTDEPAVYLHVKIQLVRGKYTLFATAMAEMATGTRGERLASGCCPISRHRPARRRVPRVAGAVAGRCVERSGRGARASGCSPMA